jgi:hypothetical protein
MSEQKKTEEQKEKKLAANTFFQIFQRTEHKSDEEEAKEQDVSAV